MRRPWLAPFVPLYAAGLAARDLRLRRGWEPVRKLSWPVIGVGNLSAGGSGKTPLTIALAKLLVARGIHIDVLSRGYARQSRQALRVDPNGTAEQFGDEPLLIAREAGVPVYVAPQRYDAGLLAEAKPALGREGDLSGQNESRQSRISAAHILDDGFQHRQLHRAVDILLLNREDWHDTLLPGGNLRETLHGAQRANIIAIPGEDPELEAELHRWGWTGPVWRLRRVMEVPKVDGPVVAFCGIARPEQFFLGIEQAGMVVAACSAFRDHHRYTRDDLDKLFATARAAKAAALVTTEKDAVRQRELRSVFSADFPLTIVKLQIEIENADGAIDWLIARLSANESALAL